MIFEAVEGKILHQKGLRGLCTALYSTPKALKHWFVFQVPKKYFLRFRDVNKTMEVLHVRFGPQRQVTTIVFFFSTVIGWSFRVCLCAEELKQRYADKRDFIGDLPLARNSRFKLASLSPLFPRNTQKITPVLQAMIIILYFGILDFHVTSEKT